MSLYWVAFFLFFSFGLKSQSTLFDVKLEPISVTGLSGIQSYAFAKYDNKLLIIGGRLDGLHQRQPFASFDELGNNKIFARRYFYPTLDVANYLETSSEISVAKDIASKVLCLPLYYTISKVEIDMICRIIKRSLRYN